LPPLARANFAIAAVGVLPAGPDSPTPAQMLSAGRWIRNSAVPTTKITVATPAALSTHSRLRMYTSWRAPRPETAPLAPACLAISGAGLTYRWHVVLSWRRRRSVVFRAFWPSVVCAILFILLAVGILVLGGTAATPMELLRELFG
jgi:hypothetical protein